MIRVIETQIVICDKCGKTIAIPKWQDVSRYGWCVPPDGAFQWCPKCLKLYKQKRFEEAQSNG